MTDPDDAIPAANPFDGSRFNSLPALLPGGLHSRELRQWADGTGHKRLKARLVAVSRESVTLVKSDGSAVVVPLDRLSESDAVFVSVQARAVESADFLTATKEVENAPRGVLAALDALSDAHAAVRVASQR